MGPDETKCPDCSGSGTRVTTGCEGHDPTKTPCGKPFSIEYPCPACDGSGRVLKATSSGRPAELSGGPAPAPIDPESAQHGDHWVLPPEARAAGHVRPVRLAYRHEKCGTSTTMPPAIAETWAKDLKFYGKTFCCRCREYLLVEEFVWPDGSKLGT